jgi:hypothetical protein
MILSEKLLLILNAITAMRTISDGRFIIYGG